MQSYSAFSANRSTPSILKHKTRKQVRDLQLDKDPHHKEEAKLSFKEQKLQAIAEQKRMIYEGSYQDKITLQQQMKHQINE